jgi:hypothetical protein
VVFPLESLPFGGGGISTAPSPAFDIASLMRTCLSWIQPYSHEAIVRHLLNTVNLFLCSSTNYFENRLLPNDLIIVRNHGDDEEDKQEIKRALESQGDVHINMEIKLTYRTHTKLDLDVLGTIWCTVYLFVAIACFRSPPLGTNDFGNLQELDFQDFE